MAVQTLGEVVGRRGAAVAAAALPQLLADGVRAACAAIFEAAHRDVDLQGMGTTVTALCVRGGQAVIAHVGDSRCYLQRGERILQLTDDHSLVNEQVKAGIMTWEQSRQSRLKNVITRSVGFERDVAVDTFVVAVELGDQFLLCSDGLSNAVDDAELGLEMTQKPLEQVPVRLVEMACERGGDDNVTVVCVRVEAL
jgi:protein phosphatase